MISRATSCGPPLGWKYLSFSLTFIIIAFCIGNPGGGGVEARRKYTYLNKWYKVACIAENLKVGINLFFIEYLKY